MGHHLDGVGKKMGIGFLAALAIFGALMLLPVEVRKDIGGGIGMVIGSVAAIVLGVVVLLGVTAFFDTERPDAKWFAALGFGYFGFLIAGGLTGWTVVGLVCAWAWVFAVPSAWAWSEKRRVSESSAKPE